MPTNNQATSGNNFAMTPQSVGNGQTQTVNCYNTVVDGGASGGIKAVAQNRLQGTGPNVHAAQFRRDEWAITALLREPGLAAVDTAIQSYQSSQAGTSQALASSGNEKVLLPDSAMAAQNASLILPILPSEANHKLVLALRASDGYISPADIQQLQSIAAQCEALGGKAVNIARGLLASEGILIWEDPGCPGNAKVVSGDLDPSVSEALRVELWPNPTGGKVYLSSRAAFESKIQVFDALGNVLLERRGLIGPEPMELDGSNWSQGVVLVRVTLPDGRLQSWRVAIQR